MNSTPVATIGPNPNGSGTIVQHDDGSQWVWDGSNPPTPFQAQPAAQPVADAPVSRTPGLGDAVLDVGKQVAKFAVGGLPVMVGDAASKLGENMATGDGMGAGAKRVAAGAAGLAAPVLDAVGATDAADYARTKVAELGAQGAQAPQGLATLPKVDLSQGAQQPTQPGVQQTTPQPKAGQAGSTGASKPTAPDAFDAATKAEVDAQREVTKAEAAKDEATAKAKHDALDASQARFAADQAAEKADQDALQARFAKLDAMVNDYQGQHVDPQHWWKSRTEGQRVMAHIGIALGAAAQAFGGVDGSKMIADAIHSDIAAQESNLDRQGKAVEMQRGILADFTRAIGDKRAARAAASEYLLKQSAAKVEAIAADSQSAITQAKGKQVAAGLLKQAEEQKMQRQKIQAEIGTQYAQAAHLRAETAQLTQQMALQAKMRASGVLMPTQVLVNGQRFDVGDKEIAKDLDTAGQTAGKVLEAIDEMDRAAQQWGSSSDKTKSGLQYKAAFDKFATLINSAEGVNGVVSAEQRKLYEETLGNHATTPTDSTRAALSTFRNGVVSNANRKYTGRGLPPLFAAPRPEAQQQVLEQAGVRR